MKQQKYFGTDGIRGRVGSAPITPELILKLGWALGRVITNGNQSKVIIGKDTRVSGYMLESALEAGLSAAGVNVNLLGPMPTPGIAYLTHTLRANAGIVISASHNLFEDNGIKFFSATGSKFPDEMELAVEAEMEKPLVTVSSSQLGKASRIDDAPGRYIEFCKSTIAPFTRLTGLKIVVDCAHGATYHIAPNVFSELGADVVTIGDKPNGFNINDGCGSTSTDKLAQTVLETKADIGVALDGDGDRLMLVDATGMQVNGDQILYIIAKDRHQRGVLEGGVVGTCMSNGGLEFSLACLGIPFERTKVGDRYVLESLHQHQWKLGGEPSGHIVCLDKTTTGDGIIAALQVLMCMVSQGKTLQELAKHIPLLPQTLINIKTNNAAQLANHPPLIALITTMNHTLEGCGRILLRPSGTEPLLRVMIEGQDPDLVKLNAQKIHEEIVIFSKQYC
ncbi:MAG: phosphoglucosamine mutase [Legionella sp.]|nr:phosphoglucosamine mutase [Legionella sp.]